MSLNELTSILSFLIFKAVVTGSQALPAPLGQNEIKHVKHFAYFLARDVSIIVLRVASKGAYFSLH